jgi:O-methyltransferase
MSVMHYRQLIKRHPLVSDQMNQSELACVLRELERVLVSGTPGAVLEFGCYIGTTSLFIRRLLDETGGRDFIVYDSFEGLPDKTAADDSPAGTQFEAGKLKATRKELVRNFQRAGLQPPTIRKKWFSQISASELPDRVAFAFLDGDFYESICDSLRVIEDRLSPGSVIVIDDYQEEALPGVRKAVDEWLDKRRLRCQVEASLAIIRLPV